MLAQMAILLDKNMTRNPITYYEPQHPIKRIHNASHHLASPVKLPVHFVQQEHYVCSIGCVTFYLYVAIDTICPL